MEGPRAFRLAGKLPEALAVKLGELGSRGYREEEPRGGGETPTLPRPLALPLWTAQSGKPGYRNPERACSQLLEIKEAERPPWHQYSHLAGLHAPFVMSLTQS
ncbi:hypothetical protein R6Z07F_003651 [Ovis aries]